MLKYYPRDLERRWAFGWVMEEYIGGLDSQRWAIRNEVREMEHLIEVHLTCQEQSWEQTAPTKTKSLFIQRDVTGLWTLLTEEHLTWSFSDNIYTYLTVFNKLDCLVSKSTANQSSKLRRKKSFGQQTESKEGENYFLNWPKCSKKRMEPFNGQGWEGGECCNKDTMQVFPHHSWWSAKWLHMVFMSAPAQWGK